MNRIRSCRAKPLLALAAIAGTVGCSDTPRAPRELPEGLSFGHPDSVLFWTPEQQLAGFPNYDLLFDTRLVPASSNPSELPSSLQDFGDIRYSVGDQTFDLAGFLEHNRVAGLIIVKDGVVLHEEYTGSNTRETRWVSYSVAKSVVSLLFGAAIQDGYIRGVDDLVTDYVPVLEGGAYEGVRIRDVLQMRSGVEWNEDYTDPAADVSREIGLPSLDRLRLISAKPRVASPGARFNYSTGETHLAGTVLRGAVGNNLATYLHAKIWEPFGMEADANWRLVEPGGAEHGGCCLSATLRDYARLGLFVLSDGVLTDGRRVLPTGWMAESTAPPSDATGFGYLWWLDDAGSFSALGIFGQMIHIDPTLNLVIATHSAWPQATGAEYSDHRGAFIRAVKATLR